METCSLVADLVKAFGLKREADLATLLGARSPTVVSNWKRENHIPWKRRYQIERLAAEQKIVLPASFQASVEQTA